MRAASWQLSHLRQAILTRPVAALAYALCCGLPWAHGCPGCGRERVDSCTSWKPCEQHSFITRHTSACPSVLQPLCLPQKSRQSLSCLH